MTQRYLSLGTLVLAMVIGAAVPAAAQQDSGTFGKVLSDAQTMPPIISMPPTASEPVEGPGAQATTAITKPIISLPPGAEAPRQSLTIVNEPVLTPVETPAPVIVAKPKPQAQPVHAAPHETPSPVVASPAPSVEPEHMEPPPVENTAAAPAPEDSIPVVPSLEDLTLNFAGASSDLTPEAQKKLDAIIRQLNDMADGRLQVRGFASGENGSQSSARRIALSRVLSVRSYLMDKGVKPTRVDVRAMGTETDRNPLDRVDLLFEH